MKILMLTPSFYPSVGGVQTHVRRVCEELARVGHRAIVICRREDPSWPMHEWLGETEVVRVPARRGFFAAWLHVWRGLGESDLVHCHEGYSFARYYLPFRLIARRKPVFITFHGYEGWPLQRSALRLRRLARRLCRGSICVGEFIRQYYGTACDVVTYGGVDAFAASEPQEDGAVFVGRLERDTGVLGYLEALRILRDEHGFKLPLHICGEGSLRGEVERTVRVLELDAELHGAVSDPVAYLRRGRFAFVNGYLSILTAMALGRRVFALYETPIKRDYLGCFPGAEYAVVTEYPGAVAAELAACIANPDLGGEQILAAREFAAQNTWDKVAAVYLDLWQRKGVGT